MQNIPQIKMGIISVSRGCFPVSLSERRRHAVVSAYAKHGEIYDCPVTVENQADAQKAAADVKANGVTALCVFLGNFGPETPETMIAQFFDENRKGSQLSQDVKKRRAFNPACATEQTPTHQPQQNLKSSLWQGVFPTQKPAGFIPVDPVQTSLCGGFFAARM